MLSTKNLLAAAARLRASISKVIGKLFRQILGQDAIQLMILGYVSYILLGWLVLCLPICHQQESLRPLDHLFISTSAVSTTGLTTISTSDSYSWFGEFVVLVLIQFGGLGYMTLSSFTVLAVAGELSPLRNRISQVTLTLPDGFEIRRFLRVIFWFTLIIEVAGAMALYPAFAAQGVPQPAWQAIFHSVSAFCTAGFGLLNNSLENFRNDRWVNAVITLLSYLGAIGFIVLHDLWLSICHKKPHDTLSTKVILWSTFWIGVIGTVLFVLEEPTLQNLSTADRWMSALFQVMSASTTVGFNSISISALSPSSMFLLTVVMVIGASPSGTGGGLKTTTFSALWSEMVCVIRRQEKTTFWGRVIPEVRMRAAVANVMFYTLTLCAGIYVLSLVDQAPLIDQIFECASALGTVGLSRGMTGSLSISGKWVIIVLMFVGRVGPVMLGMSFLRPKTSRTDPLEEDVAV